MTTIPPEIRRLSGKAVGARGSGKTLYAAWQTYQDFRLGVGSICIDPMGALSNYILSRIMHDGDVGLWQRVIYVPVGGMVLKDPSDARRVSQLSVAEIREKTWVIPTPFLYDRTGHDTLQDRTARFVGMMERLHPEQANAAVQGMTAIKRTANYAGMLLAAMGNQLVPDAAFLIDGMGMDKTTPSPWAPRIRDVAERNPMELARPAHYFLDQFPKMRPNDQLGHVATFLSAIDPYVLNPRLAAQYGANAWGVDLTRVERGDLVLFDCHYLPDEEHRAGTTWLFTRCMEYFRSRGPRRDVVGFVLDELSYLADRDNRLLEKDFEDLIARLGRNYGISCFFTYQEVTQPGPRLQQILDMVGYSLYAGSSDPLAAQRLTQLLDEYDPEWLRREEPMYLGVDWIYKDSGEPAPIDYRPVYYTPQEQEALNQAKYRKTEGLTFRVTMARAEGEAAQPRGTVHIRGVRQSQPWPDIYTEEVKRRLIKKHGRRVADVLAEIATRQPKEPDPIVADQPDAPVVSEPPRPSRSRWETIPQPLTRTLPSVDD